MHWRFPVSLPAVALPSAGSRLVSWLPSGPQRAAYLAALGLVAIQVGIGVIMKASQTGGSYSFSPSASVTISEFLKMCLSTAFFYRECRKRAADGVRPSTRGGDTGYSALPAADLPTAERAGADDKEAPGSLPPLNLRSFWSYVRGEVTSPVRYGFCNLALFYVLINNAIFVAYKLADPGTINLIKSGVTFITALVMIATLGTRVSKNQWGAIVVQVCGLLVTQYNPETGTTYSFGTYLVLIFQVFLSASSGVYNQALLKTDDSSLHADNMILYAAGSVVNFMIHITLSILKEDEPSFFEGYNSFGAIMVIVSNVFIGLAITAVYKYADAVIKCFATAVATGILLYISPVLFGTKLSFLVLPGTVVVFVASYMYMDNPPPRDPNPQPAKADGTGSWQVLQKHGKMVLVVSTIFTIMTASFLTMFASSLGDLSQGQKPAAKKPVTPEGTIFSPFKNTMAMVRWNSKHPERVPMIEKYAPFFHTIHVSMPDYVPGEARAFHNATVDQFAEAFTVYVQVARTMRLILETQPEIEGLLFYHFDAWIDPLRWASANFDNIWYPSVTDSGIGAFGGPKFVCMNDSSTYQWWGWDESFHRDALAAIEAIPYDRFDRPFRRDQWCLGWSDIYYVPRRFFDDFAALADVFAAFSVMHEVAIPSILHIIDQARRPHPLRPALDRFGDCWGSCCASNPTVDDVVWARCGHRLNFTDVRVAAAFFDKLDGQVDLLGREGDMRDFY